MTNRVWPWLLRALWVSQPLLVGPLLADALDGTSTAFSATVSIGLWTIWALTLLAALVPLPLTLTAVRIVIPAAVPAALWTAVVGDSAGAAVIGISVAIVTAAASLHPAIGATFVDGASYGDERRLPLRAPALLLLAPIPMAWAITVLGAAAGPMLLAAEQWIAGAVLTVVGLPAAAIAARALHGLARRWLVFVPAGIVLHDSLVLSDPVLFRRQVIAGMGPALADTEATDLTAAASGLALQVDLDAPAEVRMGDAVQEVTSFMFTPTLPGVAMVEARTRRIPTT